MYGIIYYYEPFCGHYVRKSYRIDGVSVLNFQEKVRFFKEKNRKKKFHVSGTIHFRHTGKTMLVE